MRRRSYPAFCTTMCLVIILTCVSFLPVDAAASPRNSHPPADGQTVQLTKGSVNLGNMNVCPAGQKSPKPCSSTHKLTYSVTSTTTFGQNLVVTQGTPNLDFTLQATTCQGTVNAGGACTVSVTFTPLGPGVRMGAVQLLDASGNLLITTFIYGQGQAPTFSFNPAQNLVRNGADQCKDGFCYSAVAVDAAGNLFVEKDSDVLKIAPDGTATTVASGFPDAFGLAVDGAGNLYIASDVGLVKIASITGNQVLLGSWHFGIAVDKRGNLFVAGADVEEIHVRTGKTTVVVPRFINGEQVLFLPVGVAVDGSGNVFVEDADIPGVWFEPAGSYGKWPSFISAGGWGIGMDPAGDVFVASGSYYLREVLPDLSFWIFVLGSELQSLAMGVAADAYGSVYVSQEGSVNDLVEIRGSQPLPLDFGNVPVGSTSAPQSITFQNVGNQPLNAIAPGLVLSRRFVQVPGSGQFPDCSAKFSLAPGAICNLSISFVPKTAGQISGTATFTDNAMNKLPSASQIVNLTGTGVQ